MPPSTKVSRRFWLTFSADHVKQPLIWQLSQKHAVAFDIRSASVTPELGLMAIEFTGSPKQIDSAVTWLQRHGVQVDPV
jgi:ABC-type methionine transport system ATPase subunit